MRHEVHLLHGGIGKVHGGLLFIPKVKNEMHQVLSERGDPLLAVFGKLLRNRLSRIQFILLQIDRFQLTAVYCYRRGCAKTTPQMTRFRDGKVFNNWLQKKIDDHRIQSDYKCKSRLQNSEGKIPTLGIASAW